MSREGARIEQRRDVIDRTGMSLQNPQPLARGEVPKPQGVVV